MHRPKPALYWALIRDPYYSDRFSVMKVTSARERQVSGILRNYITATTIRHDRIVGKFGTEQSAVDAIATAQGIREKHAPIIKDADIALRNARIAYGCDLEMTLAELALASPTA